MHPARARGSQDEGGVAARAAVGDGEVAAAHAQQSCGRHNGCIDQHSQQGSGGHSQQGSGGGDERNANAGWRRVAALCHKDGHAHRSSVRSIPGPGMKMPSTPCSERHVGCQAEAPKPASVGRPQADPRLRPHQGSAEAAGVTPCPKPLPTSLDARPGSGWTGAETPRGLWSGSSALRWVGPQPILCLTAAAAAAAARSTLARRPAAPLQQCKPGFLPCLRFCRCGSANAAGAARSSSGGSSDRACRCGPSGSSTSSPAALAAARLLSGCRRRAAGSPERGPCSAASSTAGSRERGGWECQGVSLGTLPAGARRHALHTHHASCDTSSCCGCSTQNLCACSSHCLLSTGPVLP